MKDKSSIDDRVKRLKEKIKKLRKEIKELEEIKNSASSSYTQLLKTKKWKEKRKEIFKLKGKVCSKCGATKKLQVHHLYYQDGKKPWEYPNEALVVLCKDCHKESHGFK